MTLAAQARNTGPDGGLPMYVSAGCAHYRHGVDMPTLYRHADAAMYEAKFSGACRLVCRKVSLPGERVSSYDEKEAVPGEANALRDPVDHNPR